jgi:Enhancer of polycomb-like
LSTEQDSPSGLVNPLLAYQPVFSGVNPMIFFMNKKSTSEPSSFVRRPPDEMISGSSSYRNLGSTTLVCVSEDANNKDGFATSSNDIDDKDTMVLCPLTTSVEVPVDQISHVIALPAPIQRANALMLVSTPTAPRSTLNRARSTSLPKLWPLSDTILSKKPRSDTSSQPWPVEPGSKGQVDHRKIQHSSKCSKPNHSDYVLTCYANVLVTAESRCWRECGAHLVLNSDDHEGARLCVQFFRETKYLYRANQVMQPGSTNRYTHAMMWRGGRDWSLEFTDRNQWFIFKDMYEECYNRNMRAASVKNIPTPGVRMVEGENMVGIRQPFVHGLRYIRHIGSDIDVALDPSRVIYDMDSEDEEWILGFNGERELSEDLFERVMDKCEKLAYMNQCTEFTAEQIKKLMGDMGPIDVVKEIAGYWSTKRKKKDMPLIRHLQV